MESVCDDPEIIAENIKVKKLSGEKDETLCNITLHPMLLTCSPSVLQKKEEFFQKIYRILGKKNIYKDILTL